MALSPIQQMLMQLAGKTPGNGGDPPKRPQLPQALQGGGGLMADPTNQQPAVAQSTRRDMTQAAQPLPAMGESTAVDPSVLAANLAMQTRSNTGQRAESARYWPQKMRSPVTPHGDRYVNPSGRGTEPEPGGGTFSDLVNNLNTSRTGTTGTLGQIKAGEYGEPDFASFKKWAQNLPTFQHINWDAKIPVNWRDFSDISSQAEGSNPDAVAEYSLSDDEISLSPRNFVPLLTGQPWAPAQEEYSEMMDVLRNPERYESFRQGFSDPENFAPGWMYQKPNTPVYGKGPGNVPEQEFFKNIVRWAPMLGYHDTKWPEDPRKLASIINQLKESQPLVARGAAGHEGTHTYTQRLSPEYSDELISMMKPGFEAAFPGSTEKGAPTQPGSLYRYFAFGRPSFTENKGLPPTEALAHITQLFSLGGHPMQHAVSAAESATGKTWQDLPPEEQDSYLQQGIQKFMNSVRGQVESGQIPNPTLQMLYQILGTEQGRPLLEHAAKTWAANKQPTSQQGGANSG